MGSDYTVHLGWRSSQRSWLSAAGWAALVSCALAANGLPTQSPGDSPVSFHTIDLGPFLTWRLGPDQGQWSAVPRGVQNFDGVPFQIEGLVEVTGLDAAREGDFNPTQVEGIPVGRKARRLHLLHGVVGCEDDGVPVAKVVLHFADGHCRDVRLAYGVHCRNVLPPRHERSTELADPQSRQVWSEQIQAEDRGGAGLRLFATALDNPRPEVEVRSLDFVSMFSRATPVLLGCTVEEGPPLQVRPQPLRRLARKVYDWSDAVYRRRIEVRVTDLADGRPLTNATAYLSVRDERSSFYFGSATADTQGRLQLEYPPQHTVGFSLLIKAPGYVAVSLIDSRAANAGRLREEFDVALSRGVAIGGWVKSTSGQPVPDAQVLLCRVETEAPGRFVQIDLETVRTDATGRWLSTAVPASFTNLQLEVTHPDFRSARFVSTDGAGAGATASVSSAPRPSGLTVSKETLLAGQAELILEPALRLTGRVSDESGQTVSNAQVVLLLVEPDVRPAPADEPEPPERRSPSPVVEWTRTDAQGQYIFRLFKPGPAAVAVLAGGFAPRYQPVTVTGALTVAHVTVQKAKPLQGRVVDQAGRPVPGASLRVESWHNTPLIRWQARTDAEGRFTWDNPPSDSVIVQVSAPNYYTLHTSLSGGAGREVTWTLRRPFMGYGTVVDADTGAPIDRFTLVQGYQYPHSFPAQIRWLRYRLHRGRNGQYAVRLNELGNNVTNWLMVEAPGYLPGLSPPFLNTGWVTNHFRLQKGHGPRGVVYAPDGQPAVQCTLALALADESPEMLRPGQLRADSDRGELVRSDRQGRFEFPAKLDARRIFAAHEKGYAEVDVAELEKTGKITLSPWGRVTGLFRIGTSNWAGRTVVLHQPPAFGPGSPADADEVPELNLRLRTQTDAHGAFVFERVPPGWRQVSVEYRIEHGEDEAAAALSHGVPVEVKPGETAQVTLGGGGRTVVGRIAFRGGLPPEVVDWKREVQMLSLRLPAANVPRPDFTSARTPEAQRQLMAQFEQRLRQFWRSEQGRTLARQQRRYLLLFETNGAFRIDNVSPGTYDLHIHLSQRDEQHGMVHFRSLGSLSQEIVVPDGPADSPVDVGTLWMTLRRPLRLGQPAPELRLETLKGSVIKLQACRGTNVLLYFWASWAGPASTDLQALRQLHERYSPSGRLMIVGLSVDPTRQAAEQWSRAQRLPGLQCYVGPWPEAVVPAVLGVEAVPVGILIGPDGRVRAKDLRGPGMLRAISELLDAREQREAQRPQ